MKLSAPLSSRSPSGLLDEMLSANYHKEALKFTLSHLGTLSEAKRMEAERQFMKEMEAVKERKAAEEAGMRQRNEALVASAKKIQNCFRFHQRRQLARAYLSQERIEQCHRQAKFVHACAIKIQAAARGMIVRRWMQHEGVELRVECEQKHKLLQRAQRDTVRRRRAKRMLQFHDLFESYANLLQHIFTNIDFWAKELKLLDKTHRKVQDKANAANQEVQKWQAEVANKPESRTNNNNLPPELAKAQIRHRCLQEVSDIHQSNLWWVKEQLRQLSRRLAVAVAEFEDALKRIEWSMQEARVTERLLSGMEFRARCYRDEDESMFEGCIEWLERQRQRAVSHLVTLDEQQEGMLTEETELFQKYIVSTLRIGGAVRDLIRTSNQVLQYINECAGIEQEIVETEEVSDRGVTLHHRLVEMKVKINQLQDGALDRMRVGVDEMIRQENEEFTAAFTILDEITQVTLENLGEIVARPTRSFNAGQTFQLKEWYNLFTLQPWVHEETVKDLEAEELAVLQRLEADRIQHAVDAINRQAEDIEHQSQMLAKEIAALQEEAYNTPSAALAQQLQIPLQEKEHEFKLLELEELKHKAQLEELLPLLEELLAASDTTTKEIKMRQVQRDESIAKFFEMEQGISKGWTKLLSSVLNNAKELAKKSEVWMGELDIINDNDLRKLASDEDLPAKVAAKHQRLLNISAHVPVTVERDNLAKQSPMFQADGFNYLRIHLAVLKTRIQADRRCADEFIKIVNAEEQIALTVERRKRKGLEQLREIQRQLRQRRQLKAVQMQITERLKRVEALREAREQDARRQEQERIAREEAARAKRQAEEDIRKKIQEEEARALEAMTKTALRRRIRKLKNAIHKVKHTYQRIVDPEPPFTAEEEAMAKALGTRMKGQSGVVEGISNIAITIGDEETKRWQEEQRALKNNRLPFFQQVEKSIGAGQPVYIWIQLSRSSDFMITNLELAHTNPTHQFHKDLVRKKFQQITHDEYVNANQSEPAIALWIKRDKKMLKVLGDIKISYTSKEEAELLVADYVKCPESLDCFGFAEIGIWYKTVPRSHRKDDVGGLIRELQAIREHRKLRPNDEILRASELDLIHKIETHRQQLEQNVIEMGSNPLQYAIEFLALDEGEIDGWAKIFERIDKQRDGFVTVHDLVRTVRLPINKYIHEVFETVDAIDHNGRIEFGDFVKAVGTFCMFGIDQMLQFTFNLADDDVSGTVTFDEFLEVIEMLHPYDFAQAKRLLERLDLNERQGVSFSLFLEIHQRLPTLLFPAFQLQNIFRREFMGTNWWFHKLDSYKGVADRLQKIRREKELKQQRAQARTLRRHFDTTEDELKNTKSRLRRALIIARNAFSNDEVG